MLAAPSSRKARGYIGVALHCAFVRQPLSSQLTTDSFLAEILSRRWPSKPYPLRPDERRHKSRGRSVPRSASVLEILRFGL